ncbi:Pseudouridine-5'-phosphate glycosidase [Aquicella siphonis]|uniref:Pseudouridine-5'-phosphate glycosidase n=1 Tax=Aquicella siphonis TaxID=254247 RepID=A0A5E4PKI6_9COXI|nr:pseudouridine-5'-phosphate glycosidase [Aquicella siphonis]VVC76921.1 Pseudouridine-5'-phosphate glycosidase [Aquicella siphonis]
MQQFFEYSEEVKQAMMEKRPLLALESTLITHGLPFPKNLETALAVEKIARENSVTPATIAIMNGKIRIGLTHAELESLVEDKHVMKASTRDIPYLLSQKLNAGTTVASTLFCADFAGIKVFATGGIGGVHRGQDQDISADLITLAKTPMAVVCAGAKAILDVPKTLEFLETHGVPVIGYRTETFPAFYTAETDYKLFAHVDNVTSLANLLKIHWQLGMSSGVLIANPIPSPDEIPADIIEPAISSALKLAEKKNVHGKEITPFLLSEIAAVTQGKSLHANINLIINNVRLGAMLALKINAF